MERIQPPQLGSEEQTGERSQPVPASRDPKRLPALIEEALGAYAAEQRRLAGEINALLVEMRAPGNEAEEAKAVLKALEVESLGGLVDDQGRSCRAEAVETLLACGFPYALEVKPEDLEHRAQARGYRKASPVELAVGAGVVGVGVAAMVLTHTGTLKWAEVAYFAVAMLAAGALQVLKGATKKPDDE